MEASTSSPLGPLSDGLMSDNAPEEAIEPTPTTNQQAIDLAIQSTTKDVARLRRLLWIFGGLLLVLLAPSIAARFQYALTSAKEQAEVDVARVNLKNLQLDQLSTAFRLIAKSVGPSVVNIHTHQGREMGQGSGVIVDSDGYIITNYHVVRGVHSVEVHLSDGRLGSATVIGFDELSDVAVLKTELDNLIVAEWGDSDALDVGDMVWAIGSPFGLQKSTTFGIVSAKERRRITPRPGAVYNEFLQTDAAVNPGNSGGPLVNIEGKIVGINTAIVGPQFQGISFAIPSTLARETYRIIRRDGKVTRGFLGVHPSKVTDRIARKLGIERNQGVLVSVINADSPAYEAGFELRDVILKWDGIEYSDPTLLSRAIAASPIGSQVEVEVVRLTEKGPENLQLEVTVAARPPLKTL